MKKMLETIQEIIKIPSVSGDEIEIRKVLDYVKKFFTDKNVFITEFVYDNASPVMLVSNKNTKDFDYLVVGHLDVVPAKDEQFFPYIEDEKLYGRGSIDMKSQIVIAMYSLLDVIIRKQDIKMGILITTDEETTSNGIKDLIKNENIESKIVMDPDAGNLYQIIEKYKHSVGVKLRSKGVSGHSSRAWTGVNAINKIMTAISKLEKYFPIYSSEQETPKDTWIDTMCVTAINTAVTSNVIPDFVEANLNFRLTDKTSLDDLKAILDEVCSDGWSSYEVVMASGGCYMDANSDIIQKYKKMAEKIIGEEIDITHMNGATDARMFAEKSCIIMHMISGGEAHSIDEYVELSSIKKFYEIQKEFIKSL